MFKVQGGNELVFQEDLELYDIEQYEEQLSGADGLSSQSLLNHWFLVFSYRKNKSINPYWIHKFSVEFYGDSKVWLRIGKNEFCLKNRKENKLMEMKYMIDVSKISITQLLQAIKTSHKGLYHVLENNCHDFVRSVCE